MYVILALIWRANETNDVYNPNALVRLTDFYNLTDIYNILQGTQYQDILIWANGEGAHYDVS